MTPRQVGQALLWSVATAAAMLLSFAASIISFTVLHSPTVGKALIGMMVLSGVIALGCAVHMKNRARALQQSVQEEQFTGLEDRFRGH
jgi:hypothetical protein